MYKCTEKILRREFEMSLSDGASDDDMPLTLPAEGSHSGSIRKVRHLQTHTLKHTCANTHVQTHTLQR